MAKGRWWRYVVAYLVWAVFVILGLWFIVISREGFLSASALLYVHGSMTRGRQVRFLEKVFTLAVALVWLVFMVVSEEYLRRGAAEGDLPRRIGRLAGPEFLLIFLADLSLFVVQGDGLHWLRWLILGVELALGLALTWLLGWRSALRRRHAGA